MLSKQMGGRREVRQGVKESGRGGSGKFSHYKENG